MDAYLVPIPRGLHNVAIASIQEELSGFRSEIESINEPDELEYCQYLREQSEERVGTLWEKDRLGRHVSVGYLPDGKDIWSTDGIWSGSVWLHITTNAPAEIVHAIPGLGPLLAVVRIWNGNEELINSTSIEAAKADFQKVVAGNYSYDAALNLWRRHTKCWSDYHLPTNELKFRVSCVRGGGGKDYKYKRTDFLREIVDLITPKKRHDDDDDVVLKVDLKHYDLEIVLLLLGRSSCMVVIGLMLRPNQLLGTKSFEGNTLPPDTSPPYLSGKLTCQLTRLRPSTAHLLQKLANITVGEMVLDPCAGIGTIPFYTKKGIGFGGDLCLSHDQIGGKVALEYVRKFGIANANTNLCTWDAGSLPLRKSSIDVIVSDLPFGQQCLSSQKLTTLLPVWLSEFARVLRPGIGRMVLLCGAYKVLVTSLQDQRNNMHTNWKIKAIFPVNISGLLAWIVMANRRSCEAILLPNYRQRLRKHTAYREVISKSQRKKNVVKKK